MIDEPPATGREWQNNGLNGADIQQVEPMREDYRDEFNMEFAI